MPLPAAHKREIPSSKCIECLLCVRHCIGIQIQRLLRNGPVFKRLQSQPAEKSNTITRPAATETFFTVISYSNFTNNSGHCIKLGFP